MTDRERRLLDLAGELSDLTPVDWEALAEDPDNEGIPLHGMSLISKVARIHHAKRASQPEALVQFVWGPLQVLEELGRGSNGTVYRAWDSRLATEVALKLRGDSDRSTARQWLEEARRLARIRHPNVVRVLGADVHDGRAGIWMELLEGPSFALRFDGAARPSGREIALSGLDLCEGLAAIHAAGMLHGDVAPHNILRVSDGRCVLLDLGSSRERAGDATPLSLTPLYCAPEVLRGEAPTVQSDVYALGAVLHRVATGEPPVAAEDIESLRAFHADERHASRLRELRPELPATLVRALERALSPSPQQRPATMAEFARALERAVRQPRRSRRIWFASAAAALAVALVAFVLIDGFRGEPKWDRASAADAIAVESSFFRVDGGSREPLLTGSRVQPGQQLRLELRVDRESHAYVLNEDLDGNLFLLFPLPGGQPENPLAEQVIHSLPGELNGDERDWLVTSAGGRERFLIVVAEGSIPEFEAVVTQLAIASADRAAEIAPLSEEQFAQLRGVGGTVPRAEWPDDWESSRIQELAALLDGAQAPHGALWYRQYEFLNPKPR